MHTSRILRARPLAPPHQDLGTTPLALEVAAALSPTRRRATGYGVNLLKGTPLFLPRPSRDPCKTPPRPPRPPLFTHSKGRGRIGRPRPKSVRGLPGAQRRVTHGSPSETPKMARLFTLSKGRGRTGPGLDPGFGRLRPKSASGLPLEGATPASTFGCNRLKAAPLFTLSWGRGRIGRPRPNSVRGLPLEVATPASTFGCNRP